MSTKEEATAMRELEQVAADCIRQRDYWEAAYHKEQVKVLALTEELKQLRVENGILHGSWEEARKRQAAAENECAIWQQRMQIAGDLAMRYETPPAPSSVEASALKSLLARVEALEKAGWKGE